MRELHPGSPRRTNQQTSKQANTHIDLAAWRAGQLRDCDWLCRNRDEHACREELCRWRIDGLLGFSAPWVVLRPLSCQTFFPSGSAMGFGRFRGGSAMVRGRFRDGFREVSGRFRDGFRERFGAVPRWVPGEVRGGSAMGSGRFRGDSAMVPGGSGAVPRWVREVPGGSAMGSGRFRGGSAMGSARFRGGFGMGSGSAMGFGRFRGGSAMVRGRFRDGFREVPGRFRDGFRQFRSGSAMGSGRFRGGSAMGSGRFRGVRAAGRLPRPPKRIWPPFQQIWSPMPPLNPKFLLHMLQLQGAANAFFKAWKTHLKAASALPVLLSPPTPNRNRAS